MPIIVNLDVVLAKRKMRLNTVALFVGLVFWWYLWGIPGAILAVPIMAAIKINNDLERMGDLAEDIAERAIHLAGLPSVPVPAKLQAMAD